MKKSFLTARIGIASLVIASAARGSEPKAGTTPSAAGARAAQVRPVSPAGNQPPLVPLKGPLVLDRQKKKGIPVPPQKVVYSDVIQELVNLREAVTNYDNALHLMMYRVDQCNMHQYTVEEQVAAGCKGTDTLDQCKEKLFLHCINDNSDEAQSYKKWAQKLLDETPKAIELLKKHQLRVKYEVDSYDLH